MRITRSLCLPALLLMATAPSPAFAVAKNNQVMVIGALHDLHDREPAFGYDILRAAILAFAPDILVLEVRPDELSEKRATPGRPEYPAVIWPLLAQMEAKVVAMEPGGAMFKAITGDAGKAFDTLRRDNPDATVALSRLDTAVDHVLLAYWQNAAQVQDQMTESLAASVQTAQFALAGPGFAAAQSRWEAYMTDRTRQTARANPDKRILVIGSYKNRAMLDRALREAAPGRVISAETWFAAQNLATRAGTPDHAGEK